MTLHTDYIERFIAYLISDKGCSRRTIENYRTDLLHFASFADRLDASLTWDTLDADVVRGWVASRLDSGIKPQTVRCGMSSLRSFFRYLLLMKLVDNDPTRKVRNPKAGKTLPVFIKASEMDRLLDGDFFTPDFIGLRDRYMMLLFYSTGVRLAELLGLRDADFDLRAGELTVLGKRNKQRIIPMTSELVRETARYIHAKQNHFGIFAPGPLIVNENGQAIERAAVYRLVRHYLSLVTTQRKRSPHVLRHTFATVMLNNGADLEAVKELLGHDSLATTEVYTHTTFTQLSNEYKKAHPRGGAVNL